MIWAGIFGLGAVWGWLAAQRGGASGHPGRTLRSAIPATLLPIFLVLYLADWRGVILLLGAAVFSFSSYLIWLRSLRNRVRKKGGAS